MVGELQYRTTDGKLLYIESGANAGKLAYECCCEEGLPVINWCGQTPATGCDSCSCCNADSYIVCIDGGTGDCADVNDPGNGWVLPEISPGEYKYEDADVKIELSLGAGTYIDFPCHGFTLTASISDGIGGWIECFSTYGDFDENHTCSRAAYTDSGEDRFNWQILPRHIWTPDQVTVTFSGITVDYSCQTTSTHGWHYLTVPNPNGSFTMHRVAADYCIWYGEWPMTASLAFYLTGTNCTGTWEHQYISKIRIWANIFGDADPKWAVTYAWDGPGPGGAGLHPVFATAVGGEKAGDCVAGTDTAIPNAYKDSADNPIYGGTATVTPIW